MKKRTKINLLIAWDWIKDYHFFILGFIFVVAFLIVPKIVAIITGFVLVAACLLLVYLHFRKRYLIKQIVKLINEDKKIQFEKQLKENEDKLSHRRRMRYLSGHPVTVIDKKTGSMKVIQVEKEDIIVSTMN